MANILVIDDDDDVRLMLAQALAKAGHRVIQAQGGNEGSEILSQHPIDLVVTDIVMEDGEGLETIIKLRDSGNSLPIIAMSGGGRISNYGYLKSASVLGADLVLGKPFGLQNLIDAVDKLLEGRNCELAPVEIEP